MLPMDYHVPGKGGEQSPEYAIPDLNEERWDLPVKTLTNSVAQLLRMVERSRDFEDDLSYPWLQQLVFVL